VDERIKKAIDNFRRNGIKCTYFEKTSEAKEYILSMIGEKETVGFGGSKTLLDMEIHKDLNARGNKIYWHWLETTPEGRKQAHLMARDADFYLTSSNAITETGEIVNKDGTGNRVSAMIFGPRKTVIVCGINKLCKDVKEAFERIEKEAAPLNAKRLNMNNPCVIKGECSECNSKDRICNVTTIIHKKPSAVYMEIVLINEKLGF